MDKKNELAFAATSATRMLESLVDRTYELVATLQTAAIRAATRATQKKQLQG